MNFEKFSDEMLAALHRIAKTHCRPFFTDPVNMIRLRNELIRRGLL